MSVVRIRPRVIRRLSGLLAGAALVAAVSTMVGLLDEHVPLPSLLTLYLLAVLPVAIVWGPAFALLVAAVSAIVFVVLFLAPVRPWVVDTAVLFPLVVIFITAAVVGELAARSRQRARESARLTDQQAALRRVATLVARATPAPEVFDAVIREVAVLSRADLARLERYEEDGTVTGVAVWSCAPVELAVGTRLGLEGLSIAGRVWETRGPARVDSFADATGPIAQEARDLGIHSSVGCPIFVAGRLWGVMAASTKRQRPFPANTEAQLAEFTELVATAIANAQSRAEITELLEDQAALRRIATLVARDTPTAEVVTAVGAEVARVLGAVGTLVVRLDADGLVTVVARTGIDQDRVAEGTRWRLEPPIALATALATGRPAGLDDLSLAPGAFGEQIRALGVRAVLAIPIVVSGRSWGALAVGTRDERFPTGTEQRLVAFTELVAIAVADSENAAQLAASRARIVAASDEARRQIERDLHDGAQQRLVALGLELRLTQNSLPPGLSEVRSGIGDMADELTEVLDELREMSRGIHPAILTEGGLGPALRTLARRSTIPVELDVRAGTRFPEPVEVAAYYAASEALTNTAKHAGASYVEILLEERRNAVWLSVKDDGAGGADPGRGTGLLGIRDRVEALGGSFEVSSSPNTGTLLQAAFPLIVAANATPTDAGYTSR
jgi:signal transduction histidine kinase